MVDCPDCGARSDLTKDGEWAHCASCNNIFEPSKVSSGDKGGQGEAEVKGEGKVGGEEKSAGGNESAK